MRGRTYSTIFFSIAAVGISSLFWWFYLKHREEQFDHALVRSGNTISLLKQEISDLNKNYQTTVEELDNSKNAGEQAVAEASTWESRYKQLSVDYDQLKQQIPEIDKHYQDDLARLNRARDFLASQNNLMLQELHKYQLQAEKSDKLYQSEKDELNSKLAATQKKNAALIKEVKRLETMAAQKQQLVNKNQQPAGQDGPSQTDIVHTQTTEQTTTPAKNTGNLTAYRTVRLQSLKNTMVNQDSSIRKNILISVIPTIPDGVSDTELLELTDDMQSEDILAVVQKTNQYINRPLDEQTVSSLLARMNEKDAEITERLFFNKK